MERQTAFGPPKYTFPFCWFSPSGGRARWQWEVGEAGQTILPLVAWLGQSW